MAGFNTGLHGLLLLTRAAFDDADFAPEADTLYIVRETSGGFSVYLGTHALLLVITQADYDALTPKDPATVYIVT